jgi:hypothetical protein
LNKLGRIELSIVAKIKPTAGPMRTQPVERVSTMPTPVLPMMPTAGKVGKAKTNKGGWCPRREGENNAAVETAERLEGLVSRIDFPIQISQK